MAPTPTKYSQMDRSIQGLCGTGEWQTLKSLLPDFKGKPSWTLAAAMAGISFTPRNKGRTRLSALTFRRRCLKQPEKRPEAQGPCTNARQLRIWIFPVILSISLSAP